MNFLSAIERPVRKVGLTGSMGTGKSTAAGFFRELGVPVIDADELAKKVVEPGRPAFGEIVAIFGPGIVGPDGRLDRALLASRVFSDRESLKRLEAIVHPRVKEEADREMERLLPGSVLGFVVYDVPLLFETGLQGMFDLIVTVRAGRAAQSERVAARSGLTPGEIADRLAAQMDVDEKARLSHAVLENDGSPDELRAAVLSLARAVAAHNAEKGLTRGAKE